ncbi:uncharacterized protein LOC112690196 isoform X2 [Sipha flava]|nr:uncharacterized protein LOC112690196 isoform X2 [Sipha flava]XP_025419938.1 uncharacterized protein LOC112690196 isoform X2 [Sipha flava]
MCTQNSLSASMALKSMCWAGIDDYEISVLSDIIDQVAAVVDRELRTLPELNDGHLSVLNDEYSSAVNDNVIGQHTFTTPTYTYFDDDMDYDDIENFLANFDFSTNAAQRDEVNRVDSIHRDRCNQPNTADAFGPVARTDNATNFIIIDDMSQGELLQTKHKGRDVKYFYLTVNVNESYLCDVSKTTINVYDPRSPVRLTSQQLRSSSLNPVSITIDTESAARLSLELAEASAKSKSSSYGAGTAVARPPPMSRDERRAKLLMGGNGLVNKIRSFHKHSFSESSDGIIGNWSHRLDRTDVMSATKKMRNMTYCARHNPVAHTVTHTLNDYRRRDLPTLPEARRPRQ